MSKRMGENGPPILLIPGSAQPVCLDNVKIPERRYQPNNTRQHAFVYHNAKVEVRNLNFLDLNCCNYTCDGLDLYAGGKLEKWCPCFSKSHRDCTVCAVFELKITTADGTSFNVHHHTSKSFTRFFFKDKVINPGICACQLSQRRVQKKVRKAMKEVVAYVNDGGELRNNGNIQREELEARSGFTVIGWSRLGQVLEQGVEQPVRRNEEREVVYKSEATFHVTSVQPTCSLHLGGMAAKLCDIRQVLRSEG